jgi:predicted Zn-dependent peptidase
MSIRACTLSSGMPVVLESMSGVRSVGLNWFVPAGSATDPEHQQGLGAMWSELLYRGAGNLDSRQQADEMDRLGIGRSADVATQHLRLGATLLGEKLPAALPLLVEMIRDPRMDEASIEPVRDLALQAIDALKDDPQERAILAVRERHNPPPLNRSGMGLPDHLEAMTRDDLLRAWHHQVRPVGSILAIAGDLDSAGGPDAIIEQLEELLQGWTGAASRPKPGLAPARGSMLHIPDPSNQVQIVLMHDAPAEPSSDNPLERIVTSVLSGGMGSRLFTEVREKRGLCYSVSSSYSTDRDYGRCFAYVGTTPERAQQSLDVLLSELRRVSTPGGAITPEEFQRAKIGQRASLIFSGESTGARAGALASDQYRLGAPRSLDQLIEQLDLVTLEQVNAYAARRVIDPVTIVALGPVEITRPTE